MRSAVSIRSRRSSAYAREALVLLQLAVAVLLRRLFRSGFHAPDCFLFGQVLYRGAVRDQRPGEQVQRAVQVGADVEAVAGVIPQHLRLHAIAQEMLVRAAVIVFDARGAAPDAAVQRPGVFGADGRCRVVAQKYGFRPLAPARLL